MLEIKESDWKVLRCVHPRAVERFCERVLAEVDRVLHDNTRSSHERYRQIFRVIEKRDREIARIFDDPRRSRALTMLAQMRHEGLLTDEEFSSLSAETRGAIEMMLGVAEIQDALLRMIAIKSPGSKAGARIRDHAR